MTDFYCVITNREYLQLPADCGAKRQEPIWKFFDPAPEHFLTSLAYLRGPPNFPHRHSRHFFDCGAWSYKGDPLPRWTPEQCIEVYARVAKPGDFCAAPDHMVLPKQSPDVAQRRIRITLRYAADFLRRSGSHDFTPVAVVHGNSLKQRIDMTKRLLRMGYDHLALGGVAARRGTGFLTELLTGSKQQTIDEFDPDRSRGIIGLKREHGFYLHIFGVSALSWYHLYRTLGVDSYDGSTMFFQAFTGSQYYWTDPSQAEIIRKFVIKGRPKTAIPECACLVCRTLRSHGIDTREMGSNENNMGRAVHNVNMYLRAKAAMDERESSAGPPTVLGS